MTSSAHADKSKNPTILLMGDSISAAYGIAYEAAWASLLAQRVAQRTPPWQVANASISGETTVGARQRLPALLQKHQPEVVIIELGGNDGLRGYPLQKIKANLQNMIQQSEQTGAEVLLLGMRLPPNYGKRYNEAFFNLFDMLAKKNAIALVAFFMEGVASHPDLMKSDGIHPNDKAQEILLENLWPALSVLLDLRTHQD